MRRPSAERLYYGLTFGLRMPTWVVMAVYLVRVLHLSPLQLVLMGTVMEAAIFLFEMPTGVVADTYSRRLSQACVGLLGARDRRGRSLRGGLGAARGRAGRDGLGGKGVAVAPGVTFVLNEAGWIVLSGGVILIGLALLTFVLSPVAVPGWVRWFTLVGVAGALATPAFFPAALFLIWALVIGGWLSASERSTAPEAAAAATA